MIYQLKPPARDVVRLYGAWTLLTYGTAAKHESMKMLLAQLQDKGWNAWDDGGFPRFSHWHAGVIKPGDLFVWEPTLHRAVRLVKVTRIMPHDEHDHDPFVFSINMEDRRGLSGPRFVSVKDRENKEVFNDLSRWREACVPLDRIEAFA